jgi:hypothetical protein
MSKDEAKKGSKKKVVLAIVLCLIAIILLKMTFILLIVGMLPTIVVYFVDNSQSRSLFHTVMACNLSGVLPFVGELWAGGNETSMVGMMLSDMQRLLIMYLSAALGWTLMYICPIAARFMISGINQHNIQKLRNRQKLLRDEWGQEVSSAHNDIV